MNTNLSNFIEFVKRQSDLNLVILRHDAIKHGDDEVKKVIDEELKRREKK